MKKLLNIVLLFITTNVTLFSQYSTTGTDFCVAFFENYDSPAGTILYLSSEVASSGSVVMQGWSQNFTIPANGSVSVTIPPAQDAAVTTGNTVLNKGIRIRSDNPITVYAANQRPASSDASLILPVHALGDSYIVTSYTPSLSNPSEFIIAAVENGTSIEIIPKANVIGGVNANTPFTINLNAGEVYLVKSYSDLTGSSVKSTNVGNCNNFAVFGGSKCANVPVTCTYCDHLYEQMIPVKAWGQEYITAPLMGRNGGDIYRVVASEDATSVNINNGTPITLNAGQFHEVLLATASSITANKPISVAQYSRGGSCDGVSGSDPFMIILSPVEQVIDYIVFQAFTTSNINQFYITIISETAHTGSVMLNGSATSGWAAIPSNPVYSFTRMNLPQGTHVITSIYGVLASIYGFGSVESYGYLAGANIQPLNVDFDIIVGENPAISYQDFNDVLDCNQASDVTFRTNSPDISDIRWNFGDGSPIQTGNEVHHSYPAVTQNFIVTMSFIRNGSCARDSISMTVSVNNILPPIEALRDSIVCNGQPYSFSYSDPNYDYEWQDGSTSRNYIFSQTGDYSVTVTDANGCTTSSDCHIEFITLTVNTIVDEISCAGAQDGSITANPSGTSASFLYEWNTTPSRSTQTIDNLADGSYTVIVTDSYGCKATATQMLSVPPPLATQLSSVENVICYGSNNGRANIIVNGGTPPYSIAWSDPLITGFFPANFPPGNYYFSVTDSRGCYGSGDITIETPPELVYTTDLNEIRCFGEPGIVTINVNGGTPPVSIRWQDGNNSLTRNDIPVNTNFTFTITDSKSCTKVNTIYAESPLALEISDQITDVRCKNGTDGAILVNIRGGVSPYNMTWSNNIPSQSSVRNLRSGVYKLTVTDMNNCMASSEYIINEPEDPLTVSILKKDATCNGSRNGSLLINATGGTYPYEYRLYNSQLTIIDNKIDKINAGNYNIRVKDRNSCIIDTSVIVNQPPKMTSEYSLIAPTCYGNNNGSIILSVYGGSSPYTYKFEDSYTEYPVFSHLNAGKYHIEVYDSNRCRLELKPISLMESFEDCLVIPNAFSPNGDGVNDYWIIEGLELFPEAIIEVFNKWGQNVFSGVGHGDPWDGKYRGKELPTGSYVYVIDVMKNNTKKYKGTVTIIY